MLKFFGVVWIFAAWITHVIVCFKASAWGFLIAGAIFFPVAWAHGTWSWFQICQLNLYKKALTFEGFVFTCRKLYAAPPWNRSAAVNSMIY